MAFNNSVISESSLIKKSSDKILSTFTKTKEELSKLNLRLFSAITVNEEKIKSLTEENAQMELLKKQHDNVIENIEKFLGNI